MGRDKATIGWPGDAWSARVRRAVVAAGVDDVLLVGGDGDRLPALGAWIPDREPGAGPAAAIASLQAVRPDRHLLVAACDLPELTGAALAPLLDAVDGGAPVAVPLVDRVPAWSVVAISTRAAAGLVEAVSVGVRSLHECLEPQGVEALVLPEAPFRDVDGPFGPEGKSSERRPAE